MALAKRASVPSAGEDRRDVDEPPTGTDGLTSNAPSPSHGGINGDEPGGLLKPGIVNVKLIYAAFLVALAVPPAALFGAWSAHQAMKKRPPAWLMTHYTYQMRTFWIGLGANLIAWALTFAGIGLVLLPLIAVWVVARAVHGLIRVAERRPVDNPESVLI